MYYCYSYNKYMYIFAPIRRLFEIKHFTIYVFYLQSMIKNICSTGSYLNITLRYRRVECWFSSKPFRVQLVQ